MTAETKPAEGTLNLAVALENMGGDAELLEEIVGIFRETAPDQLADLAASIAAGSAADVAIKAHGLKGGASNFCATAFVTTALELERLAKSGSLDGAPELLATLNERYAELSEVLGLVNWSEVAASWTSG